MDLPARSFDLARPGVTPPLAEWSQFAVDYVSSVIWRKLSKLQPFETILGEKRHLCRLPASRFLAESLTSTENSIESSLPYCDYFVRLTNKSFHKRTTHKANMVVSTSEEPSTDARCINGELIDLIPPVDHFIYLLLRRIVEKCGIPCSGGAASGRARSNDLAGRFTALAPYLTALSLRTWLRVIWVEDFLTSKWPGSFTALPHSYFNLNKNAPLYPVYYHLGLL